MILCYDTWIKWQGKTGMGNLFWNVFTHTELPWNHQAGLTPIAALPEAAIPN